MAVRKAVAKNPKPTQNVESNPSTGVIIWDLGRAYFAYVGLLERILVEQKLDHILRPGMGVVLFALYEKDRVSIKDLAQRSQLACSTLTGVLQRMEVAGLVTRNRDASDGRLVKVALTNVGRGLEKQCRQVAKRMTDISDLGVGHINVEMCTQLLKNLTVTYRQEEQRLSIAANQSHTKSNQRAGTRGLSN